MAVSEIRIGKDLGATTSVTYSLGSGCDASTVLTPTFDSNCSGWLTGTGGTGKNGTVNLATTQANTGGERSGYLIPSIKGKQCTDYKIKVTQEAGGSGGDCRCTSYGRYIGGSVGVEYGGPAPATGFTTEGRSYVIGFYKKDSGTCSVPTTYTYYYKEAGDISEAEFNTLWSGVQISVTDQPQKKEDGVTDLPLAGGFTHYVIVNKIPKNTLGKLVVLHLVPNNECTDYFTFNQYA